MAAHPHRGGIDYTVARQHYEAFGPLDDQCACPAHRNVTLPADRDDSRSEPIAPGPWFAARYGGRCSRCGEDFREAQTIRADGDGDWECCESAA